MPDDGDESYEAGVESTVETLADSKFTSSACAAHCV